jgi:hypothetical protein
MEIGVRGHSGVLALSHVILVFKLVEEPAQIHHLKDLETIVLGRIWTFGFAGP